MFLLRWYCFVSNTYFEGCWLWMSSFPKIP
jgi:hypothetical protein